MRFEVTRVNGGWDKNQPPVPDVTVGQSGEWTLDIESLEALVAFAMTYGPLAIRRGDPPIIAIYGGYIE
jgi:hypothetical protein